MNNENPYRRFKGQFENYEWDRLNSNPEFRAALDADDYDKAGRLADRILIGETKSISEGRKMKKEYDEHRRCLKKLLV